MIGVVSGQVSARREGEYEEAVPFVKLASVIAGVFALAIGISGGGGVAAVIFGSLLGIVSRDLWMVSQGMATIEKRQGSKNDFNIWVENTWLIRPITTLIKELLASRRA